LGIDGAKTAHEIPGGDEYLRLTWSRACRLLRQEWEYESLCRCL